jgi:hypothetical protein
VQDIIEIGPKGGVAKVEIAGNDDVIASDQCENATVDEGLTWSEIQYVYIDGRLIKES